MKFSKSDSFHLRAAQGWIELGNITEANEELEKIEASLRSHPGVLLLRWLIYAKAEKWDVCLDIARALTTGGKTRLMGFKHMAFSLHKLKRTAEAYDVMLPLLEKYPDNVIVLYDVARYAAQLGRLDEAKARLEKAFEVGDSKRIKLMALDEPDLEPLWKEIGKL